MTQVNMDKLSTTQEKQVTMATTKDDESGNVLSPQEWAELDEVAKVGYTKYDQRDMQRMGKKQQFRVRYGNLLSPSSTLPSIEKFQALHIDRIHELCNGYMGDFTHACRSGPNSPNQVLIADHAGPVRIPKLSRPEAWQACFGQCVGHILASFLSYCLSPRWRPCTSLPSKLIQ